MTLFIIQQVGVLTINTIAIIAIVLSVILSAYAVYSARKRTPEVTTAVQALGALHTSLDEVQEQVQANKECHEANRILRRNIEVLESNEHSIGREMEAMREELSDMRHQIISLSTSVETQDEVIKSLTNENAEAHDVFYIMLGWMKDALQVFDVSNMKPPDIPEEVYEFEKKYKGRFKNE